MIAIAIAQDGQGEGLLGAFQPLGEVLDGMVGQKVLDRLATVHVEEHQFVAAVRELVEEPRDEVGRGNRGIDG
ncbi:MAG: hypothetical protein MUC40_00980 [Akkermansiaceae bacterium]|nr:hypothetical protein [Akkermansiaceae bacterium]